MIEINRIYNEDCLEGMKRIPDGSVDMVLADLPYGTTQNKWDTVIPFDALWEQYNRVCKENAAVVLFGAQPFTSHLIVSAGRMFRQSLVWEKNKATGHLNANRAHLRAHEDILVFYKKLPVYNPQMGEGSAYSNSHKPGDSGDCYGTVGHSERKNVTTRFPRSVLKFDVDVKAEFHPTQKPVALLEYLIKTYTNEGETVLDNCMGSGTTAIACINTNRNYIGFELDAHYCDIANERIQKALAEKEVGE